MKLNAAIIVSFCTTVMLTACQKDKQPDTNTNLNKVKTYTESISISGAAPVVATYNVAYDTSNRITSLTQVEIPGNKFSFSYTSDIKYSMDIFLAGALSIHEDFFLNSNFLPDSTYQYNDTQDTTTEKYLYNSNNHLITLKEYIYSKNNGSQIDNVTTYTYDSNGNVVKTTDTDKQTETFDYYPDLVYAKPFTDPSLKSAKATNLVKTHTVTSNGSLVGSVVYTYTFDSNKRISTITQTTDDGSVGIQTFTYF